MQFKQQLTYYRKRAGLNKTQLAEKISVSPPYIMDIEAGRKNPPKKDKILKMIKVLNLNVLETKKFIDAAIEERAKNEFVQWLAEKEAVYQVPLVSWVKANHFGEIIDPYEIGNADEYVSTTAKGENIFALKVKHDCMEPEFVEGDIVIVNPNIDFNNNDFVIVKDLKADCATFKQIKIKGTKTILHPLNPKYKDIEISEDKKYKVIGKIIEKVKKY